MIRAAGSSSLRRMTDDNRLLNVLRSLRERGAIGEESLSQAITHSEAFVAALPYPCHRVIDLGSGGGLPGLIVASRRPDLLVVLTDRRERRVDLLRLASVQLGIGDRVEVLGGDVVRFGREAKWVGMFDAVTARSFGAPLWTLQCAVPFLRQGGAVIVSEPPSPDAFRRWPTESVAALGLRPSEQVFPFVRRFVVDECFT